jgi:hypothetical protein
MKKREVNFLMVLVCHLLLHPNFAAPRCFCCHFLQVFQLSRIKSMVFSACITMSLPISLHAYQIFDKAEYELAINREVGKLT